MTQPSFIAVKPKTFPWAKSTKDKNGREIRPGDRVAFDTGWFFHRRTLGIVLSIVPIYDVLNIAADGQRPNTIAWGRQAKEVEKV